MAAFKSFRTLIKSEGAAAGVEGVDEYAHHKSGLVGRYLAQAANIVVSLWDVLTLRLAKPHILC